MNHLIYKCVSVLFIFICFIFVPNTVNGQINRITNNSKNSHESFLVGHSNGNQKDSLISRSAIIIPRTALKNSSGIFLRGILDSISFFMAEGCGYNLYNSTLKIYALSTTDSTIDEDINDFIRYRNAAKLIFFSDEVKFPDSQNTLIFTTNHAFEYKDSNNIIILTEWIRPRINYCFRTKWYGDFVTDASVMNWENFSGNFTAARDARFRIDVGLSINPNLKVCSNKSSFTLSDISGYHLNLKVDSAPLPIDIDLKRKGIFENFPTLESRVSSSTSISGLLPGIQYTINSKDTCSPSDYTGFNYKEDIKTPCTYDQLDQQQYVQTFEGLGESNHSLHCWTFQNPNYGITNTSYSNSGNYVMWFYKYYNHYASSMAFKMLKDTIYEISYKYLTFGTIDNFHVVMSTSADPNDTGVLTDTLLKFNNNVYLNRTFQFKAPSSSNYYIHFILKNPINNAISLYVDDVNIRKSNNCLMPVLDTLRYFDQNAYVNFSMNGNTIGQKIELTNGQTTTNYLSFQNKQIFNNLTPYTDYTIRYQGICKDSSLSNVGIKTNFKTRCNIDTLSSYHYKVLQRFENWTCLEGNPVVNLNPQKGITGLGLLVNFDSRIVEGNTILLHKNDSITLEIFNNPYYPMDTTTPNLSYYIDGDTSNRVVLQVKTSKVSFTNFKRITASLTAPKDGLYTLGVKVNRGQNPILDDLSVYKSINCNSITDVLPLANIKENSAVLTWKLKDTSATKTFIKLMDLKGKTTQFSTNATTFSFNNLNSNTGYFVHLFTICGSDTGNAHYPIYFKTLCEIDTINHTNSLTVGFEDPNNVECFEFTGNDFVHQFGRTNYSFEQPVTGEGYLYSLSKFNGSYTNEPSGSYLKSKKVYLSEGNYYRIEYDYLKYPKNTVSLVQILNEADSIIKSQVINYTADQLSGKIVFTFRIDRSGIYKVRLRMEDKFSIDNFSLSVSKECKKIGPENLKISHLPDTIQMDFTFSNTAVQSINIETNIEKPNQHKWNVPVINGKARFSIKTEEAKFYKVKMSLNCLDDISDSTKLSWWSRNKTLDSITNGTYWNTTFDDNLENDKKMFPQLKIEESSLLGFPSVSGRKILQFHQGVAETYLPLHYLDSGLNYAIRFLANSTSNISRGLTILVISQNLEDTLLNFKIGMATSAHYSEILKEFTCSKKGLYFIKLSTSSTNKNIYIENFTYRGYPGIRTNDINSINQVSDSSVQVNWSKITNQKIKNCVIQLYPYEETTGRYIVSDTVSINDTFHIINKVDYNKEYSVKLTYLDSFGKEYCSPSLKIFLSKVKLDSLRTLGSFFEEDFEKSKAFKFIPNGGSNYFYSFTTLPNPEYTSFNISGINAYNGGFTNKGIYLFKDSLYVLSVNATCLPPATTGSLNFVDSALNNSKTYTVTRGFKNYSQNFTPLVSGFYKLGFYNPTNHSILYDDFKVSRLDTNSHIIPVLRNLEWTENGIKFSWNHPKNFNQYILEKELEGTITRDTIKNLNDSIRSFSNLELEKTYNFKVYFNDTNTSSTKYKFVSGHIPDTITVDNFYIEDYENDASVKRIDQFRVNTDCYRSSAQKKDGLYSMTFDYQSSKSNYQTFLAKVYLKANTKYTFACDYKSSGSNTLGIFINDTNTFSGSGQLYSSTIGTTSNFVNLKVNFQPNATKTYYIILRNISSSSFKIYIDNVSVKEIIDCNYTGGKTISFSADSIYDGKARIQVSNKFDAREGLEYTVNEKKYKTSQWNPIYTFQKHRNDTIFYLHNLDYTSSYSISAKAICQVNNMSSASSLYYINPFCTDPVIEIDSTHSFIENFDKSSPIPDCWTFSNTALTNKLSANQTDNSVVLGFPDNNASHAISKTFSLKSSQSYTLEFDYFIEYPQDTIFYAIYDDNTDTILKAGYVNSLKYNGYSMSFNSTISGPCYLRIYKKSKITIFSDLGCFIDNLSLKISNFCTTDKLDLIANNEFVSGKIEIGSNTQYNVIKVVNTLNWNIDTIIFPSSQSNFTYQFKSELKHLFEIKSICKTDTGRSVIYSATKGFKSIQPDNGWCENFKKLEDNHMQPGWSATGGRTVYMNPSVKIGECLGITNNPLTNDHEKQYTNSYLFTRRVYYIESPNFILDVNKRYNVNMDYNFSHGAFECCKYPWEVGLDSIHAELYDEVTKNRFVIGSIFELSGNNLSKTKSIDFTTPYSGNFKIRVYAHITINKTSPPVNLLIDDFCIKEITSCNAPPQAKLKYDKITNQHVISWPQLSSAKSGYFWYMVQTDSNRIAFSGATRKASDTSQVLYDIEKNLNYRLYVRSNCSQPVTDSVNNTTSFKEDMILSDWSNAYPIITECLTESPNDGEIEFDFEKNIGDIPYCWIKYSNNWSVKTQFDEYRAQNSKAFLFLNKSTMDSIATGKFFLTKDTAYAIKIGILSDGRKGISSVSAWLIDHNDNKIFIGDFEKNAITTTYIDKYLDFKPPFTGDFRIMLLVNMTKESSGKGIAFDNLVIRKRTPCTRPVVLGHDGLNKESIQLTLDSTTISNEIIVRFRMSGNNFKLDTFKLVNHNFKIDRRSILNSNWSATSIANLCAMGNEFSSEFIIPPMKFDSIRIKLGSPYVEDFNTEIEPLSAIYGWDYYMPTDYNIEKRDILIPTPEIRIYDKGYLRLNSYKTSTIPPTAYIGTPWMDLDKFEPYTIEFRLNKPWGNELAYGIVSQLGDTIWLHPSNSYSSNWNLITDTFKTRSYGLHKVIFAPNDTLGTLGIDNLKITQINSKCPSIQQALLTSINDRELNFKIINSGKTVPVKWKILKDISNYKLDGIYSGVAFGGDSVRIPNLPVQSKYYLYTQRACAAGDTSQWYECFQFIIYCEKDSLSMNLSKCEDFEIQKEFPCYNNNSWSISSQPVDGFNTTNGTTFLYTKSKTSANLMSGYFIAKRDESMDVSFLLHSDSLYGIDHFSVNLYNVDSSKTYNGIVLKNKILKNKDYLSFPIRIPSDGIYRLSFNGLPNNNGFILLDDICITKKERCLSPTITSFHVIADTCSIHLIKPKYTDSVSLDLWALDRQGQRFIRTEYQSINNSTLTLKNLEQDQKYTVIIKGFCSGHKSMDSSVFSFKTDCRVDTIKDKVTFMEGFEKTWLDWSTGCNSVINKNIWMIDTTEGGVNSVSSLRKYNGTSPYYSKKFHILAGRQYEVSLMQRVDGFGLVQEMTYGLTTSDSPNTYITSKTIKAPTNTHFIIDSFKFSNDSNLDVRFFITSRGGNYVYFDDIRIMETFPCVPILNSKIDSVFYYGAQLSWQNPKYPIKKIEFVVRDRETGNLQNSDTIDFNYNTYSFNGLKPGKSYVLTSRSYCPSGDTSDFSDSILFKTLCPIYTTSQFNQFGSLDYNDSNRYCWSLNNTISDPNLNWQFEDSIVKENLLVTDYNDKAGAQYLSVKGSQNGYMAFSSVNTPMIDLNDSNNLLHFRLTNNRPVTSGDEAAINNSLYLILIDTSINQIDTLLLFNGSLPNIWTSFNIEIPNKFEQVSIQFNYLQNSDSTDLHAIALDGMKIMEGKCPDLFKSDHLSNDANNTLCLANDSNLFIGKDDELAYIVHLTSKQGTSLYHLNANIGERTYNLSDSFSIHNSNYYLTTSSVYGQNNKTRLDFVDSLKFAFSEKAFNALADSVLNSTFGQISLNPEDLKIFTTSEKIDLDARLIRSIASNKLDSLTFNPVINSQSFNITRFNNKLLIGLDPNSLQNWLSISAHGIITTGLIPFYHDNEPHIYPNPFENQIIIQSDLLPIEKYELFDISGRSLISEINLNNSTNLSIETGHLNAGVYTLSMTVNKKVYNYKLLKM